MKRHLLSSVLAGAIAITSVFSVNAAGTATDTIGEPAAAVAVAEQVTSTAAITEVVTAAVTAAVAEATKEVTAIVEKIAAALKENTGASVAEAAKAAGVTVPSAAKPLEVPVVVKNVSVVDKAQLQAVLTAVETAAKSAGLTSTAAVKPILEVQTTDKSGAVVLEIKVDVKAALAAGSEIKAGGVVDQSGKTFGAAAAAVSKVLDAATVANVKQLSFEARETFPVRTQVSVKASLFSVTASTNLNALNYYSYQPSSNKFVKLAVASLAPKYSNGFLTFNTKYAGDFIVTPTPLGKK